MRAGVPVDPPSEAALQREGAAWRVGTAAGAFTVVLAGGCTTVVRWGDVVAGIHGRWLPALLATGLFAAVDAEAAGGGGAPHHRRAPAWQGVLELRGGGEREALAAVVDLGGGAELLEGPLVLDLLAEGVDRAAVGGVLEEVLTGSATGPERRLRLGSAR